MKADAEAEDVGIRVFEERGKGRIAVKRRLEVSEEGLAVGAEVGESLLEEHRLMCCHR